MYPLCTFDSKGDSEVWTAAPLSLLIPCLDGRLAS